MDIIVRAKNCEVPARLKEEALLKVEHATRFFDRLLGVEMTFSEEHNPRIAEPALVELTARAMGHPTRTHHIRALGAGEDHRGAVDVAVTRFERQLARYKARLVDRQRGRHRVAATGQAIHEGVVNANHSGTEAWPAPRIVRIKRFELSPMLPDEAALQLELLGHDFFLFTNAATGRSNVVYRRRDGDLGVIEAAAEEPAATS